MTAEPRLWVLNFDAEDELAHPGAMTPSAGLRARFEALARRTTLLRPGDARLDEFAPPDPAWRGMPGAAWCPTPGRCGRSRGRGRGCPMRRRRRCCARPTIVA